MRTKVSRLSRSPVCRRGGQAHSNSPPGFRLLLPTPAFMGISKERKGEVVQREELIRILLEFAAKPAAPEQQKLRQILANDGVPDPTPGLADIRAVAQQLELT